ncbi:MAG: hypothetical protein QUS12_15795 [Methanosarcina sp.]|nr:hypothetical protein [Methanosarcina sp.]
MNKLMEIVVYILAVIGLTCVVKHIHIAHCKEGCCLCNSLKTKAEGSKSKAEGLKTKAEELKTKVHVFKTKVHGFKIKEEEFKPKEESEKRIGSRYGSNPVRY